jgi:hypothetical protein
MSPMEKLLSKFMLVGYILTIMLMPIFYGIIFFSSFLDFTPAVHPKPGHEDHGPNIWNGMPKAEYEKIKYLEEHKY